MEYMKCKFCRWATSDKDKLEKHILTAHWTDVYEKVWINDDEINSK